MQGTLDAYLSAVSNRLNETMKRLTVIARDPRRLTVITGVYGMNFEHMPELKWRYGYLVGARADGRDPRRRSSTGSRRRGGSDGRRPSGSPTTSSTRSRPARWWSGRPPWSRSWWRTRSTRERAACTSRSRRGGKGADPRARRRPRDGPRGRGARPRAPRHLEAARASPTSQRSRTHGFRGEALPSIASVVAPRAAHARRRRARRAPRSRSGTAGRCTCATPAIRGAPPSRCATSSAAVPARRKFLRADSTEAAHVAEAVTLLALARPGVGLLAALRRADRSRGAGRGRPRARASSSSSATASSTTSCPVDGGHGMGAGARVRLAAGPAASERGPTCGCS